MSRDTSTDTITSSLIERYCIILRQLDGWGVLADTTKAVYHGLYASQPQEPFPCAFVYLQGIVPDYSQGRGLRRDVCTIGVRILGGPVTPNYKFNAEEKMYEMITGVVNALAYRPFLENPLDNDEAFRYLDPNDRQHTSPLGRVQNFNYSDKGNYVGIDVPCIAPLRIPFGRVG